MATVLITGCSSGFGLLSALLFARRGDRVVATLRNPAKAGALERARDAERLPLEIVPLDVLDDASVKDAVAQATSRGPIDVLVNNAGVELRGPIEETLDDEARWQFDTNFFGALRVIRAVLPGMRERRRGTIVNVTSIAGLVARPFGGMYAASKHALEAATEALHFELKPFGVRVALVEPGQYETPLVANMKTARRFDESSPYRPISDRFDVALGKLLPGGKRSDPQEVAEIIHQAVYSETPRLRWLAGADARTIANVYQQPFEEYAQTMRKALDFWD